MKIVVSVNLRACITLMRFTCTRFTGIIRLVLSKQHDGRLSQLLRVCRYGLVMVQIAFSGIDLFQ